MRDDRRVRTTLDIDDDVLQAAKEIAAARRKTTGEVLSELAEVGYPGRPTVDLEASDRKA